MVKRAAVVALVGGLLLALAGVAGASHSWGNYHWPSASTAKTPFTIQLGDNLSADWDPYLATSSTDWSVSAVFDTAVVAGGSRKRNCGATSGRVEVCNDRYGFNGWLGVAQIWTSGDHIAQATVRVNDSYLGSATYGTPAWKNHVICQEIGHTFGLDHQDESGASLGTCMDYASDPTNSQHPNAHDYEQLETIYWSHTDSGGSSGGGCKGKGCKGKAGAPEKLDNDLFVEDLGGGNRRFTHVYWVEPGKPHQFPPGLD